MRGVLKRLHKITESGEGGHLKITLNIPLYPLVFQYFWELVSIYYTIFWGGGGKEAERLHLITRAEGLFKNLY